MTRDYLGACPHARSLACSWSAAAVLFSTGGAAIKAANFTGWQIASFRIGYRGYRHPAVEQRGASRAGAGGSRWLESPMRRVSRSSCWPIGSRPPRTRSILQSTAPLYLLILSPWLLKEPMRPQGRWFHGWRSASDSRSSSSGVEAAGRDGARSGSRQHVALASGFFWALTVCGLRWMGAAEGRHGSPVAAVAVGNLIAFLHVTADGAAARPLIPSPTGA